MKNYITREKVPQLKKEEIPKQKDFTKKQLRLIKKLEDLMDECYNEGLIARGMSREFVVFRKDNYDIAEREHEGDNLGRNEVIKYEYCHSDFYEDSGSDDQIYYK